MFKEIRSKIFLLLLATFVVLPSAASAQNPVSWTLESDARGKTIKSGERFKTKLKAKIEDNWHLYAVEQPEGGPYPTKISIAENSPFKIDGKSESPAPVTKFDANFNLETKYFAEAAEFNVPVAATGDAAKAEDLAVNVKYQVCDDKVCLPPKTVRVSFAGFEDARKSDQQAAVVSTSPAAKNSSTIGDAGSSIYNRTPNNADTAQNNNSTNATNPINSTTSLASFIWLAITLGALSLLTPCVFPMIPITVSYFTNHSAGNRGKAVRMATVYSLGIIGTFTLIGMLLAIFVGATGITVFASNPYVNLLIAGIFLFFAFNLFGAYEIAVPTNILTKLDGLTRSREGEGSGIIGALLMGLTFSLTSFTCTSPFVGTILVSASQGDWQMPLLGMLAFSTVFALPFFVLALLPQYVSSLPRAGGWMNSIKVAMGFLEIAAAMKFLSNVDLIWKWEIFTRNFVLSIWIAIGAILAVYLLGKFQLPHDSKPERIGAIRVVSAILSLAISFYLLTGLFGAKLGELESFLPPETETSRNFFNKSDTEKLRWIDNDLDAALAQGRAENKRVFIDFTGYTCTNCRWMEANIFPKKAVDAEMKNFILARLYTDGDGAVYERQQQFQQQTFQTVALPFYAILDGDGKTIATFPGLTRDADEFVDFLKKAEKN